MIITAFTVAAPNFRYFSKQERGICALSCPIYRSVDVKKYLGYFLLSGGGGGGGGRRRQKAVGGGKKNAQPFIFYFFRTNKILEGGKKNCGAWNTGTFRHCAYIVQKYKGCVTKMI